MRYSASTAAFCGAARRPAAARRDRGCAPATARLRLQRHVLGAGRPTTSVTALVSTSKPASAARHVVGDDQVDGLLPCSLRSRVRDRRRAVSAAKPTSTGRPCCARRQLAEIAEDVPACASASASAARRPFDLLRRRLRRRVVGDRGRHDRRRPGRRRAPSPPRASRRRCAPCTTSRRAAASGASGPMTSVTAAPRRSASAASAKPIRPLERLPTKRTGSMSS